MNRRLLLLFFCLISLLPFAPFFLDPDKVLLFRDLSASNMASKTYWLWGILNEGSIPRWNYLQDGGAPFYADMMHAPLHPFNLLFLLFGAQQVPQALTVYIMLHYPLLFLGFALLLREFRLPWRAALPISLCATWCGYALSAHNLTHILLGTMSLPWFWLFWSRVLRTRRFRDVVAASFFLALPVYGGDPQFSYVFALGAALSVVWRRSLSDMKYLLLLGLLSVLCASAQLLPTLELLPHTQRRLTDWGSGEFWSIMPLRLADFVFPNFFGSNYTEPNEYWGESLTNKPEFTFFINAFYLGFAPLYLLIWAIVSGWAYRRSKIRPKTLVALAGILVLLWMTMGPWAPVNVYAIFSRVLPLWSSFRYPERLAVFFSFALFVVSARALRAHYLFLRVARPASRRFSLIAVAVFWLALTGAFYWKFSSQPTAGRPQIHVLLLSLLTGALIASAPLIGARRFFFAWIAIVVVDFAPFMPRNVWFQPSSIAQPDAYIATKKIMADLERRASEIASGAPDRLLSSKYFSVPWWKKIPVDGPMDIRSYYEMSHWEGLAGNIPIVFAIPAVHGFHSLILADKELIISTLNDSYLADLLNLMGIRYYLRRFPDKPPEVEVNMNAYPNFFFAERAVPVRDTLDFIRRFPAFPKKHGEVFLEGDPSPAASAKKLTARIAARASARNLFSISASGSVAQGTIFVWNESFYPNWEASLDDAPLAIQRANGWAMAVRLPALAAGEHRLEFRFNQSSIRLGQALTGLWLLALLFTLSKPWGSRKTTNI